MPEIAAYPLFRNYSKAVKEFLIETCYLPNYNRANNVLVAFLVPQRAFSKIIVPIIQGTPARPIIAFNLSGYEYAVGENHLGFSPEYFYDSGDSKIFEVEAPEIYKLTYSLQIYAPNIADIDIMLYQLLTKASPRAKAVKIVDRQWMEIRAGNPTDETTLEPGDAQDRVLRYGLDLTIPRAYLPRGRTEVDLIGGYDFTEFEIFGDSVSYIDDIGDSEMYSKQNPY